MLTYILFAIGFIFLIKGADLLVDGSSAIAKKLKISDIIIGLTIVAFGTSMPEFVVNLFASGSGSTEIAIGNVLGSNIANILLILGISAIIYPLATKRTTSLREIPFSLLASIVLAFLVGDVFIDGAISATLTRTDGLILLSFFIIFLYYTFVVARSSRNLAENDSSKSDVKSMKLGKAIGYIILGLIGLVLGGEWIVNGATKIAEAFNLSQSLIALTIIAVGTSLPELATSAIAAYKKNSDIAIGNVVGSNIFNIFWVLGFSSVVRPLPFNSNSIIDIIVLILSGLLLFIFMFIGKKHTIERWQGLLMLLLYMVYIIVIISIK